MKKKRIIVVLYTLFLIDLFLVITKQTIYIDELMYQSIISIKNPAITSIMILITDLASTRFIIFANCVLILLCFFLKKTKWLLITISSIYSGITNSFLKMVIKRIRPIGIALVVENGYSFPSGHSMIAMLFYGMIFYLIAKHKLKGYRIICTILGIYIFSVGISRIYLGVHYASDVIGGWLFGSASVLILGELYKKYNEE